MAERTFFDQVLDAFEGFVGGALGVPHSSTHRRGLKVWFGDATREHYEAQLIRVPTGTALEIGFHSEHPKPTDNESVLARLLAAEERWRPELGDEAEAGAFIGSDKWRRISEVWEPPDSEDLEAAIEVAARLADYAIGLEPVRTATS